MLRICDFPFKNSVFMQTPSLYSGGTAGASTPFPWHGQSILRSSEGAVKPYHGCLPTSTGEQGMWFASIMYRQERPFAEVWKSAHAFLSFCAAEGSMARATICNFLFISLAVSTVNTFSASLPKVETRPFASLIPACNKISSSVASP